MMMLFLVTVGLFLLPLTPAMFELARKTDAKPLRVVQEYDNNVRHFADGFRRYINTNLAPHMNESGKMGAMEDGTPFHIAHDEKPITGGIVQKVIASMSALKLPGESFFENEMYSERDIVGGKNSHYRALLSGGSITLDENSELLRWAHAETSLTAGYGSSLHGRATAGDVISLDDECSFERLNAPRVELGKRDWRGPQAPFTRPHLVIVSELEGVKLQSARRWLMPRDFFFDKNQFFDGDIVAKRDMKIGTASYIKGSTKSDRNTTLEAQVCIEGAVASAENLFIGPDCRIKGPIMAEDTLYISAGTVIGSPENPTSITAPRIVAEAGVVVHGTVWATMEGIVMVPNENQKASA